MFRTPQRRLWTRSSRLSSHGSDTSTTFQSHRSITLTACQYKSPNINSRNYYDLLGVERTATQKEIKQAFFKLSKEYHPDSNQADKSLHEKFVKINQAFTILNKQSSRITYDQSLDSPSRSPFHHTSYPSRQYPPPRPSASSFDWSQMNFGGRGSQQRRSATSNESDWGTPHYDRTFFEMLRRRMEQDRRKYNQTSTGYGYPRPPTFGDTYFAPGSIILFIIGFGVLLHALQWRMMRFSDPAYSNDPRSRHYHAYREWQRLSSLKDAGSMPLRDARRSDDSSSSSTEAK